MRRPEQPLHPLGLGSQICRNDSPLLVLEPPTRIACWLVGPAGPVPCRGESSSAVPCSTLTAAVTLPGGSPW